MSQLDVRRSVVLICFCLFWMYSCCSLFFCRFVVFLFFFLLLLFFPCLLSLLHVVFV